MSASEDQPTSAHENPSKPDSAVDAFARLQESERRLQIALSAGRGIGTWEWDVANDRVVSDERFARLYGVDPEHARRGAPIGYFFQGIHPDDLPRVQLAVEAALRTGELFSEEYRLRLADGHERWVLAEGRCERAADGSPTQFPGVSFDITDRKAAEIQLRDLNAELERKVIQRTQARGRTWQVSPDLLGALNSKGYFETSNPAWMTVLGWTEQEVASMSIFELLHPEDVERTKVGFNLTQLGKPAIRFPNRYRHKQGHYRWISWVGVPEDGYVYCSGIDITDEREQSEALARAEEALRQSQKMEALGQLTGGIAHDFNNLLQVILSNLHLIKRMVGDNDPVMQRIANAMSAVHRGANLSGQLLAFSRKQPINPKVLNAALLMPELEELVRRSLGDDVVVDVIVEQDLWNSLVDEAQLENAILNLAINARDAMNGRGRLNIELANVNVSADSGTDMGAPVPPGDYVAIRVGDSGPGMPLEVVERAFEPFFTTKTSGHDTGLGLSMVYGFMQQSGGGAQIESVIGVGTIVTLYLPRCSEAPASAPEAFGPVSAERGSETILVAEDDPAVREAAVALLKGLGYEVLEASNGDEALEMIRSGAAVDLLFTDVVMPGTRRSIEAAKEGRFLLPHMAVLYASGYAEGELLKGGRLDADVLLLTKPYSADSLAKHVRQALAMSIHARIGTSY
jgi:PAS domain S-box-containing protein